MAEEELSKRERQKARRNERRQAELAKAKREQAASKTLRVLGILVVLGLLGYVVGNWVVNNRNEAALKREAEENLVALGCDDGGAQPDAGAGHIEDLAALAPKAVYIDRPATSGPHIGQVVRSGVYDKQIDERLMVHNLEHGYVNVYYDPTAPQEQIDALKEFARGKIGGPNPKMIVAPKIGDWTNPTAKFAMVAWRYRQMCEQFDAGVLLNFLDAHYSLKGEAPEKTVPAHMGGQGVLDPNDSEGPFVMPPLTAEDTDPEPKAPEETSAPAEGDAAPAES